MNALTLFVRGRAASSLSLAVSLATRFSRVSLAIAPEGTRSISGQLLGFKKGPPSYNEYIKMLILTRTHPGIVHMWEDLRSPIVPFIIVGAFDLFPKVGQHDLKMLLAFLLIHSCM